MWLHLIFALMSHAKKRNAAHLLPSPTRTRTLDPIVIDCPTCNTLVLNTHQQNEEGTGDPRNPVWIVTGESFLCPGCNRLRLAHHFENDGTGVMRLKQWSCPRCHSPNLATTRHCTGCNTLRPFEDTDYDAD